MAAHRPSHLRWRTPFSLAYVKLLSMAVQRPSHLRCACSLKSPRVSTALVSMAAHRPSHLRCEPGRLHGGVHAKFQWPLIGHHICDTYGPAEAFETLVGRFNGRSSAI